jgi:predicted nucleic acid-binding protein
LHLVDTNVWLERLLDQERAEEVGKFLGETPSDQLFITDFALHSIGLVLARLGHLEDFVSFVRDLFIEGGVGLLSLRPEDMTELAKAMQAFSLDLDDAYQYVAATKNGLILISFDADVDRTEKGRKTPSQALS